MRETKLAGIPMSVKLLTIYKLGKDGNIIIFSSISLQRAKMNMGKLYLGLGVLLSILCISYAGLLRPEEDGYLHHLVRRQEAGDITVDSKHFRPNRPYVGFNSGYNNGFGGYNGYGGYNNGYGYNNFGYNGYNNGYGYNGYNNGFGYNGYNGYGRPFGFRSANEDGANNLEQS